MKYIDELLIDPAFSELMWNDFATAFAEKDGKLVEIASPFFHPELSRRRIS